MESFEDIVVADVRGHLADRDPAKSKWLRSPEQVNQWSTCLKKLKRDVEEQFTSRRARNRQFLAEYEVARETGRLINVTRCVLSIQGQEREMSVDAAEALLRKEDRKVDRGSARRIKEVKRYQVDVSSTTAWIIHTADEADWLSSAVRFRAFIERDLGEAKEILRKQAEARVPVGTH